MKFKAVINFAFILLLTLSLNNPAWSWGINDQQFLLQETATFDGAGTCALNSYEYKQNRYLNDGPFFDLFPGGGGTDYVIPNQYTMSCGETSLVESIAYSVSGDGSITFTFDDGSMQGAVSTDLNTLIYSSAECSNTEASSSISFGAGVKKGADKQTSDLVGTFAVYEFESGFHGGDSNWGWGMNDQQFLVQSDITFTPGTGTFTENLKEYRQNRQLSYGPATVIVDGDNPDYGLPNHYYMTCEGPMNTSGETGTYSVAFDGMVTINFMENGESDYVTGYLSENENVLIFSESECSDEDTYCSMGLGIGLKRGATMETGDLDGTFTVYEFESGFHGENNTYFSGETLWGTNDQLFLIQTSITFNGSTGIYTINSINEYEQTRQIIDGQMIDLISGPEADYAIPNQHTTTCSQITEPGETGTFSVISDGTITLNTDEGPMYGVLCIDGNVLILGESECSNTERYCSMSIGVGVKQRAENNLNDGSLGTFVYKAGTFESGFHGGDPNATGPTLNPGVLQLLLF